MRHLRERLRALGVEEIGALCGAERRDGERVTAGGVVVVRQRPPTSKGFVFVGLEDETGRLDVIVPPKLYALERTIVNGNGILAVRGRLGREDGVTNLRAETFFPLRLEEASEVIPSHDYR
jgi:error-prone DNA polymerase